MEKNVRERQRDHQVETVVTFTNDEFRQASVTGRPAAYSFICLFIYKKNSSGA